MTDFMRWLYANYIKPQISGQNEADYEMSLSLMESTLNQDQRAQYARALEYYSCHAFLLGARTGLGLSDALTPQSRQQAQ